MTGASNNGHSLRQPTRREHALSELVDIIYHSVIDLDRFTFLLKEANRADLAKALRARRDYRTPPVIFFTASPSPDPAVWNAAAEQVVQQAVAPTKTASRPRPDAGLWASAAQRMVER
jgi:hypothetical protein